MLTRPRSRNDRGNDVAAFEFGQIWLKRICSGALLIERECV
jgi:hypothetical protein